MAMIRKMIYENAPLTPEQINQIEEADKKPIVFDDDCPETTPEKAVLFKRVNPPRRIARAD